VIGLFTEVLRRRSVAHVPAVIGGNNVLNSMISFPNRSRHAAVVLRNSAPLVSEVSVAEPRCLTSHWPVAVPERDTLKIVVATTVAGVWLAALCAGAVHGGWFGLGDSSTSSDTKSSKSQKGYSPKPSIGTAKPAANSGKSTSGGIMSLFGLGSQSSTKQPAKKAANPYAARAKKDEKKSSSWWNSLFKPKEPPPPKSTGEWMRLKQVKW